MPAPSTFAVYAAATLAILLVPGPAVLYVVTRSVEHGRRAGLASVLGIHVGTSVHVVAAAAGLSALLVSSAAAFSVVKYAGAAYLIAVGVRRLLAPSPSAAAVAEEVAAPRSDPRRAFAQGVVVNILNPKTALFFLAFLPQFLNPDRGAIVTQVLVLGATFILLGLLTDGTYAVVAAYFADRWRARRAQRRVARSERLSGVLFVGLGVLAAVTPRHPARR